MQVNFPTAISKRENGTRMTWLYKAKGFLQDFDEEQQFVLLLTIPYNFYINIIIALSIFSQSIMHLNNFVKAITVICLNLAPVVTAIPTANPTALDPTAYYRLTNDYTGEHQALDVINDGTGQYKVHMVDLANYSGQFWRFRERTPGKYDLSTLWLGEDKCLDVINDAGVDSTSVHLADKGNYSGQFWTLTPWGDSSYRLTNDFTGLNMHLDVFSDTKVAFLDTDDHSGQHWHLTKIE